MKETVGRDVPAADGTRLRLWERTSDGESEGGGKGGGDIAVLYVHGATYPGRAVFDTAAGPAPTWLSHTTGCGRAAYALDLRGYGDSEAPTAMDTEPGEAELPCRANVAAADVAAAVEAIPQPRVHLVGYSWGTVVCGRALAEGRMRALSLTQFAPVFRPDPSLVEGFDLGAPPAPTREVTREEALERWTGQFPEGVAPGTWRDPAAFEVFWDALHGSGQAVEASVPTVRAPNGVLLDLADAVEAAPYDPSRVTQPAFVCRGSFDPTATREDALALYDALPRARGYHEVGGGTHFLPLEKRREDLFDAVAAFHDAVE
jgi:pimeloyl-ACP methyl ester carboxylesterase